jgi:predicted protein tyrosine phosphatase
MFTPLFLIDGPWPGRLAISPAPAPGPRLEKNLRNWQRLGVTGVLSMMQPGERKGWEREQAICYELEMKFYSIPIPDHSVPPPEEMKLVASRLVEVEAGLQTGERIVAHCFAGIGRSGMATVALLMIAGIPQRDAIALVSSARGLHCPETAEQREWLASFDRYRRLSYT